MAMNGATRGACLALLLALVPALALAATHDYYVQAENVLWDYAPDGKNVVYNRAFNSFESKFVTPQVENGKNVTFGSKIWKIRLFEYTDNSFTTKATRPAAWEHLGSLGPVVRGEVGDVINVHFRNQAEVALSLHPHGVQYKKDSEGAPYNDGTSGKDKEDDAVPTGGSHTYVWNVLDRSGPQENDPSSLVWLYHAHTNELSNTNLGAVGAIIVTGRGKKTSSDNLRPSDVDREIVIFMHNFDELASDYLQKNLDYYNIEKSSIYAPVIVSPYKRSSEEVRLLTGNPPKSVSGKFGLAAQKCALNGYLFGNYFGKTRFSFIEGERVRVYAINLGTYQEQFVDANQGIGSVDGMHSLFFSNQVLTGNVWSAGTKANAGIIGVLPASMQVSDMVVRLPSDAGATSTWMLGDGVDFVNAAGMQALFTVQKRAKRADEDDAALPGARAVREYNIQIEEVVWDYAPQNKDLIDDTAWGTGDSGFQMTQSATTIGRKYVKAQYIQYNSDWSVRVSQPEHMGILGPAIRATVGDTIKINLRNKATRTYSIFPYGVLYNKDSEGVPIDDGVNSGSEGVAPDETYTYTWTVPASAGPQQNDPSSIVWSYTSRHDWLKDPQSGLVGPIVISRAGASAPAKELFLLVSMFDENYSPYINDNVVEYTTQSSVQQAVTNNPNFPYTNWMFSLNGYMFGNMPGFSADTAQVTRVYLFSAGKVDGGPHAIKFDSGITWESTGHRDDVVQLMPGMSRTIDIQPRLQGTWVVHCHTQVHASRGMAALLQVTGADRPLPGGTVRDYYLQAEKVRWSYTSNTDYNNIDGRDLATGSNYDPMEDWVRSASSNWIGDPIDKAHFVGYTDDTFTTPVTRTSDWIHLGLQGPPIRGIVGDVIRVHLKNAIAFPVSIFPQGLTYDYSADNDVAPGATKTYTWYVTSESGPSSEDVSSTVWLYNSRAGGESAGINAGLFGSIIITRDGTSLVPSDVDREFAIFQAVIDESLSPYFPANSAFKSSITLGSSSRPSMNGLMFGNLQGLEMKIGERVRFYILTAGSFSSLHTFHTHGHTFIHNGENVDVVELFPTGHAVGDMIPDEEGQWLFHCHYSTHMAQGMAATYTVSGTSKSDAAAAPSASIALATAAAAAIAMLW